MASELHIRLVELSQEKRRSIRAYFLGGRAERAYRKKLAERVLDMLCLIKAAWDAGPEHLPGRDSYAHRFAYWRSYYRRHTGLPAPPDFLPLETVPSEYSRRVGHWCKELYQGVQVDRQAGQLHGAAHDTRLVYRYADRDLTAEREFELRRFAKRRGFRPRELAKKYFKGVL